MTLLRAVGHALNNTDGKRSPWLTRAISEAWQRWQSDPQAHAIWHQFIKPHRDKALKEYRLPFASVPRKGEEPQTQPRPVIVGEEELSPHKAALAAIRWWKRELNLIEAESRRIRAATKAGDDAWLTGWERPAKRKRRRERKKQGNRHASPQVTQ